MRTTSLRTVVNLAAGLGLLVSIFSTVEYFETSLQGLCSVNAFLSCGAVAESGRTTTLGIPDYLYGLGGFVLILIVAGIAEKRSTERWPILALVGLTTLGVAFSSYFVYVQVAEIGALCIICLTAEALGVIAWAGAIALALRTGRSTPLDRGGDEERAAKAPPD